MNAVVSGRQLSTAALLAAQEVQTAQRREEVVFVNAIPY